MSYPCMCLCVHISVGAYICGCIYLWGHIHARMYGLCVYAFVCVCVFIYTWTKYDDFFFFRILHNSHSHPFHPIRYWCLVFFFFFSLLIIWNHITRCSDCRGEHWSNSGRLLSSSFTTLISTDLTTSDRKNVHWRPSFAVFVIRDNQLTVLDDV